MPNAHGKLFLGLQCRKGKFDEMICLSTLHYTMGWIPINGSEYQIRFRKALKIACMLFGVIKQYDNDKTKGQKVDLCISTFFPLFLLAWTKYA